MRPPYLLSNPGVAVHGFGAMFDQYEGNFDISVLSYAPLPENLVLELGSCDDHMHAIVWFMTPDDDPWPRMSPKQTFKRNSSPSVSFHEGCCN